MLHSSFRNKWNQIFQGNPQSEWIDRLYERARWAYLAPSGFPGLTQKENSVYLPSSRFELKQRRSRRLGERQKRNRVRLVTQQLCMCITLFFFTFLGRHCTTTTWKCLISLFVENVNTRQQLYVIFLFLKTKHCQHFKWCFPSRPRRCRPTFPNLSINVRTQSIPPKIEI